MPIIHFKSVSKHFTEDSYAIKDVSFEVEPGELVFITGPSGSGKTTLMRLLTKEYTPTEGEIYFKDAPISSIQSGSVHTHRRKIGVVFQDYQLIPEMNVWENIALPLYVIGKKEHEIEQRVTDLLNLIKLPDKADQFPSQLSGGEAQRVSIARALAVGPELIFADEPTGNLDLDTSKTIARLLRKINELGTTILIATHDQDIMNEHKDQRKITLENGALVFDSKKKSETSNAKKEEKKEDKKSIDSSKVNEPKVEEIITIEVADSENQDMPVENGKKSFWGSLFNKKNTGDSSKDEEPAKPNDAEKKSDKKDEKEKKDSDKDKDSKAKSSDTKDTKSKDTKKSEK